MITINNFEIQNNGQNIIIDVETNVGYTITSVLLWKMNDFKDYTKAINLDYKLEQLDNTESITVTAEELELTAFEDVYFVEIQSDYDVVECNEELIPALGITYNLTPYYQCLLNKFLSIKIDECKNCNESMVNNIVITLTLMLDMVEKGIEEGYYMQVIDLINKLKKLCSLDNCSNCYNTECSTCSKYKQL